MGNPISDGTWNYEWSAGRSLKKVSNDDMTVEFKYDSNGNRIEKRVTKGQTIQTTQYTFHGKLITHIQSGSDEIHFFYDDQVRPIMLDFNGSRYTYVHNLLGDIIGILDSEGNFVVEYKYDAWGKQLDITATESNLAVLNPFRYRGYVWEPDMEMYWLQTRLYNPGWGRFINPDSANILPATIEEILGANLYLYCKNCPTACKDDDGEWLNILIGGVLGAAIGAVTQVVSNAVCGRPLADGVLTAAAGGAVTGAVAATGLGIIGQTITGALVGAGTEAAQQYIDDGEISDIGSVLISGVAGAASGVVGGKGFLHKTGDVYKNGQRLLQVLDNASRGKYASASKALSRITSVGRQYSQAVARDAKKGAVKYLTGNTAATAGKELVSAGRDTGKKKRRDPISIGTKRTYKGAK